MAGFNSMMSNLGSYISLMVAIPFVIVALVLLGIGLRSRRKVAQSKGWPTAMGSIQFSGVDMRRSHSSRGGSSTSYYPTVMYTYRVDGKEYQGNRIQLGGDIGYGWAGKAQQLADQYAVGKNVEVFYNPENPYEAVLERKSTSGNIFIWIAILIVVILAITMAITMGSMGFITQFTQSLIPR